ncbi:MAG: NADH-quinone oxidoreductase subunit L [Candidatus Omnitrophica bacterium]|nr:NADH-quinone oxidoreductase subunit L [Candidatus Omnitrophota bacterium]
MPLLLLIPGLPLLAFVTLILLGRRLGRVSAWLSAAALGGSASLTLALADAVFKGQTLAFRWPWLSAENPQWVMGVSVDALSWLMLVLVTVIGTLIQCYSIGYMHDDPRFSRFFAHLSLFCASMLILVMADHFVLLYAGWELVGLCSYLLISFWFEKPEAARAGRKAFLTRIGDTGLLVGILVLAWAAGDLQFAHLPLLRTRFLLQHKEAWLTLISLLVFFGAVGKSAQIPLHVWLPDAMEGPTPVSALIHAATMVAAGVYLVARTFPLFTDQSLAVVLSIGLATHLAAGTVALAMSDIKRVLAYSTISQLGLMMTALGLGAMPLAMFHLTTHACFKALLFLGAGSVIHATHHQEMSQLGGLFRAMPWTAVTFLIGALALSGVFPFSGFWSKDAILLEARHEAPWLFVCLLLGAVMTTAYIFRLYFRCFHGASPGQVTHAHESPAVMTLPLVMLALGAALVGWLGAPATHGWFFTFLGAHEQHEGLDPGILALSIGVAGFGVWLAWQVGLRHRQLLPDGLRPLGRWLYHYASNKYFIDELYDRAIIQPFLRMTARLSSADRRVIDGAVDRAGLAGWSLGQLKNRFDRQVVDRLVNGVADAVRAASHLGRRIQTGVVHDYLLIVVVSVVALAVWMR